jgi:hypothetical protein
MIMRLTIALARDEGPEVAIGNAHCGAKAVRDEITALEPATDSAGRDAEGVGDLIRRVEFRKRFGFHSALHFIFKARAQRGERMFSRLTSGRSRRNHCDEGLHPFARDGAPSV